MKYVVFCSLVFATFAFGALLHSQLAADETELWVGDNAGTPFSAISFSNIGQAYDRWVANDYEPAGGTYTLGGFAAHYCYYGDDQQRGDFFIEVYENDVNSSPIGDVVVPEANVSETDTGWVSPTSGARIFYGEMYFGGITGLAAGNTYWIAAQMDSPINAFNSCVELLYWDESWWFSEDTGWILVSDNFGGVGFETSVAFYEPNAIESVSVGTIKATFK